MDINELITIVKKKIQNKIMLEKINVEDKSFLHSKHKSNPDGKFHLKISIESNLLRNKKAIFQNYLILEYPCLDSMN